MTQPTRPSLPNLRVASPCRVDWSAMAPVDGDRVRACGQCKKHVYNLSNMTRAEAEALIGKTEGELCIRYFERKDGTIVLADCVVRRSNRFVAAGAAALLAAGVVPLVMHDRHPAVAASVVPAPDAVDLAPHASFIAHDDPPPPSPESGTSTQSSPPTHPSFSGLSRPVPEENGRMAFTADPILCSRPNPEYAADPVRGPSSRRLTAIRGLPTAKT